ncbi:phosphodiester glycosidase family protein [Desulfovibrio sp. G11]|uniref:phosphodiester glycosidase family protein n=1 Tax=Desulfovibrio sp. G11 TaxID=631220 RepID=UPI001E32BBFB|nr:phosphodiester glycosidase family protein [Desulfovibrio sp. G11]
MAAQTPSAAGVDELGKPAWRQLEPGLDFGEFQLTDSEALLTALRIDPAHFDFILCARSQDGGNLRPLNQWAEQYGLTAAINASMYLPDGITSTGYMRQNGHHNNKRVVQRFGAFFVAGPDSPDLPGAAIVDRDDPQWEQRIGQYRLVIQNYRMTSADRRILWSPGGPHYSISAVAQDGDGRILFLHCRQPVEAYAFAQQLLHLPLNVRTVMYVEGGGQAGLLVRSADWKHELAGLSAAGLLVTGDLRAQLPNVLGAVRKTTAKDESATPPAADTPVDAPASTAPPARSESPDPAEEGQESPAPSLLPKNLPGRMLRRKRKTIRTFFLCQCPATCPGRRPLPTA